ncbi:MAG: glycosyltransferase [Conexivisphaerales archaeon]
MYLVQPAYAIVIPVLNEKESLDKVLRVINGAPVYVVDDGSEDGTMEIVAGYVNAKLIERGKKMGLVSAYLDGIREAIKEDYDYFVVMDGDGQHDPMLADELVLTAKKTGADLVIGSRYVDGGGTIEGFSEFRKTVSKVANYLFMLSFDAGVRDATSGYRVYSRRAAHYLLEHKLSNNGYAGQVEIVEELNRAGMKIVEHRINLKRRTHGNSKLGIGEVMNYFLFVLTRGNLWKYALIGLSGIFVNEAALYLLAGYISPLIADIIAIEVSILSNFLLNESWTFRGRRISRGASSVFRRLYVHNAAAAAAIVVNFAVFALLELTGVNLLIANLIGIIVAFSLRYLLSSRVVWVNE